MSVNVASNSGPINSEEKVQYECCICRDEFFLADGVAPCEEHFLCNECVVSSFDAALNDIDSFPAQCCKELPRGLVEHVLSPDVIQACKARAKEYFTHRVLRVYCVNGDCGRFIPSEHFDNHHVWYTVARCQCGINTVLGARHHGKTTIIGAQTPMSPASSQTGYPCTQPRAASNSVHTAACGSSTRKHATI